jgi:hypothetical protein
MPDVLADGVGQQLASPIHHVPFLAGFRGRCDGGFAGRDFVARNGPAPKRRWQTACQEAQGEFP